MKPASCHSWALAVLILAAGCVPAEEPDESLCDLDADPIPVAEWYPDGDGVRARSSSGEGLPYWSLAIFMADEDIGTGPVERKNRGERCWSVGNGYMACELPFWHGVVAAEMCGDILVYELLESDWEELPPGVYAYQPREE